jgi:type II secretory pathway pseudopilin PulG
MLALLQFATACAWLRNAHLAYFAERDGFQGVGASTCVFFEVIGMEARRIEGRSVARLQRRSSSGHQFVELVVAIGVIAIITVPILDGLSQVHRQGTATQNEVIASNIAQEVIDNARNSTWTTLTANQGTQTLLVNRVNGSETGPGYNPRPLMLDTATNTYSSAAQSNRFNGTVEQTITTIDAGTLQLTVTVTWAGENGGGNKRLSMNTLISQFGIHN